MVSAFRIKFLTLKHNLHQKLLEFLASPNAPVYLKIFGVVGALLAFVVIWSLLSAVISVASYYSDPVSYLRAYFDPLTPRLVDTSDFRTSDENVLDIDGYREELFKLNEFNTYLSDKTPINRKHKDPRTESCRIQAKRLPKDDELVTTSIILVMHDEELSTLLRTIVSILMNTPMEKVKEIILIDDKSTRDELGSQLDKELSLFPFVKLMRNAKREGLIRSRVIGAKSAGGKILLFLDSHVEVLEGWFKPLIARVMEDTKTVVCPVIAAIDHTSLDLISDKYTSQWGAWDWDMVYKWRPLPAREQQRRGFDESQPIRTPAMAGGLFAMDKEFFFEVGAYDPGMRIWGGENLEMSFRVWMCGGALEINTCSFVGHVFRRGSIFSNSVTAGTALKQNTKRAVEVWLDEYKEAHYLAVPANKNVEAGDYVSRVLLRQRLKCKSFSWYLREVFPDQLRPDRDFVGYGELKGPGGLCMDSLGPGIGHQAGVWSCHGEGNNQFWKLLVSGELRNDVLCLDGDGERPRNVVLYECHGLGGNQQWFMTEEGLIKHGGSSKCLTHDGRKLILLPCDEQDDRFHWDFTGKSLDVQKKFYSLHSKQFAYKTIAELREEQDEKDRKEQHLKGLKEREEEERQAKEKEERERKEREEKKKKADDEKEKKNNEDEEKKRREEKKKEEEEFVKWRNRKKLGEKNDEETKRKRYKEEDERKREEEIRMKRELEEVRRKEVEERHEEERKKLEEENERKMFEEDTRQRQEKEQLEEERKSKEREEARIKLEEEKKRDKEEKENQKKETGGNEDLKENEQETSLIKETVPDKVNDTIDNADKDTGDKGTRDSDSGDIDSENKDNGDKDIEKDLKSQEGVNDMDLKEFLAWKAAKEKSPL